MKGKNLFIIYLSEFLLLAASCLLLALQGSKVFAMPAYALFDPPTLLFFFIFSVPVLIGSGLWKDLFRVFRPDQSSLIKLKRTLEAVQFMQRQILYTGCILITFSALATLYAAAETEQAFVPAQLFVTILPAIYMAALELLLAPLYTETKLAILDYMGRDE